MDNWDPQANEIFLRALEHGTRESQQAFLDAACSGKAELRANVESLLEADRHAHSFLEQPAGEVAATLDHAPIAERPGMQIGPYKLHQEIGEGGMGIVYMALQKEPVRRKVALKIIKPGMDTREVIARFAAEKQALAIMDHPNIAKVHDAGTTESGRPYFVMELVNGVSLTQYCDDNKLSTRQRLELFIPICHAVQHAHQKGIIHRDIKPSNILVTLHDGVPVPKIIDFGIAKATNQELTTQTLATGFGQMVGTPLYMSPEQAERSGLDIDTRSDIYSLGVLLHELLTGSTPFDRDQLKEAGLDEVRRIIREQEPPRPSTRISTLGKLATTASERRRTSPLELSNSLRHELDWIVMKALDKDRTRRYQTANDFARDIQRYLDDEPVEACPPSTVYRLQKFTRRHKTGVLATTTVALALILGAGVAAGQAYRASKAEKLAEQQGERERKSRSEAEHQRDLAQKATQKADAARKQAVKVTDFLVETFRSPDPERDGRAITVAELLDKAKASLATELGEDPVVRAKLLGAIGATYLGLGLVQEANQLSQESYDILLENLGPEHEDTLGARNLLASALIGAGRWEDVATCMEENVRLCREKLGSENEHTVSAIMALARSYWHLEKPDLAIPLFEEADRLRKKVYGEAHAKTLDAETCLGVAYKAAGHVNEAIALLERARTQSNEKLGPEHPTTLILLNNLAGAYADSGRPEDALALQEQVLTLTKEKLGAEHPQTLAAMNNLAHSYWTLGKLDQSIPLLESTVKLSAQALGEDHPATLRKMASLGRQYMDAGRLDEATTLLEKTLARCKEKLDPKHPTSEAATRNLAIAYAVAGRTDEALALCLASVTGAEAQSKDSADAEAHCRLGGLLSSLGKCREAIDAFSQAIRLNPQCAPAANDLAWLLANAADPALRQPTRAVEVAQKAVALMPNEGGCWNTLGVAQYRAGEYHTAIESLGKSMELRTGGDANDWLFLAMAHWQLGSQDQGRQWFHKAATWMRKQQPPDEEMQTYLVEAATLMGEELPATQTEIGKRTPASSSGTDKP